MYGGKNVLKYVWLLFSTLFQMEGFLGLDDTHL